MKQITLYGTKDKLWILYENLVLAGITPKPIIVDGGRYVIVYVDEISIEEAHNILKDEA